MMETFPSAPEAQNESGLVLTPEEQADLTQAVQLLESPSLAIQLANLVGSPIEWGVSRLPKGVRNTVQNVVRTALNKAVSAALLGFRDEPARKASPKLHALATAASGAVGGFFGTAALAVELPVTTTLMMRAIADIARSEGFTLSDPAVQAACVEVFALGGKAPGDDAADSGYYASRGALSEVMKHAARELASMASSRAGQQIAQAGSSLQTGIWLARLIDTVSARFGIVITEKIAAQLMPVVGAASGAAINTLFTRYYQSVARGHFIVRRLELRHGEAAVRQAYETILQHQRLPRR